MELSDYIKAKRLLESIGCQIVNEAIGEDEMVVSVFIHYESTTTADERTKEGRHTYYRLRGAYGLSESEDDASFIGGQRIGMFKKDSTKVSFAWTWLDVNKFKELVEAKYGLSGLTVSEQHGQTKITQEVDDEPVSTGNFDQDGPYGAGSASIWYFTRKMDRTWQIKLSGDLGKLKETETADLESEFKEIAEESMPAKVELKKEGGATTLDRRNHIVPDVYTVTVSIKR